MADNTIRSLTTEEKEKENRDPEMVEFYSYQTRIELGETRNI